MAENPNHFQHFKEIANKNCATEERLIEEGFLIQFAEECFDACNFQMDPPICMGMTIRMDIEYGQDLCFLLRDFGENESTDSSFDNFFENSYLRNVDQ